MTMQHVRTRWGIAVVVAALLVCAGVAFAAEQNEDVAVGRQLAATSVNRIEAGVEARVLDDTVAFVQLDVFRADSDVLVWTSGRVSGNAVVWPVADLDNESYRFSIKGWDRQETLVTHQVTTKNLAPIVDITFDNIPDDTKILAAGEIDLDGNVNVNGVAADALTVATGVTSGAGIRIEAYNHVVGQDALEIEMGGSSVIAQAIEVQRNESAVASVNADGSAWFEDNDRVLPDFLPIAFGFVSGDGTLTSSSGNVAVTWNAGSSRYEITITGYPYAYQEMTTLVTPSGYNQRTFRTGQISSSLLVYFWDSTGTPALSQFGFVTYANPVTAAKTTARAPTADPDVDVAEADARSLN